MVNLRQKIHFIDKLRQYVLIVFNRNIDARLFLKYSLWYWETQSWIAFIFEKEGTTTLRQKKSAVKHLFISIVLFAFVTMKTRKHNLICYFRQRCLRCFKALMFETLI